jgi:hypothetical protein
MPRTYKKSPIAHTRNRQSKARIGDTTVVSSQATRIKTAVVTKKQKMVSKRNHKRGSPSSHVNFFPRSEVADSDDEETTSLIQRDTISEVPTPFQFSLSTTRNGESVTICINTQGISFGRFSFLRQFDHGSLCNTS